MALLIKIYRFANLLSLDVVVGSVCCSVFFSEVSHNAPEIHSLITLALTVWSIYTVDHLIDARRAGAPSSGRRQFHKEYRRTLWVTVVVALLIIAILLRYQSITVIREGSIVIVLVSVYLMVQRKLSAWKEFFISIFYVSGILASGGLLFLLLVGHNLLVLSFAFVVFMNLVLFSWFDYRDDLRDSYTSIVTSLGEGTTIRIFLGLFLLLTIITAFHFRQSEFLLTWLMAFFHVLIFLFRSFFSIGDRFRLAGDAIFFLPGIYALLL